MFLVTLQAERGVMPKGNTHASASRSAHTDLLERCSELAVQLTRLHEERELLQKVHLELASAFDSRQVLKAALSQGLQLVSATGGSVILLNSRTDVLSIQVYYQKGVEEQAGQHRTFSLSDKSIAGWVVRNNRSHNSPNVSEDPLYDQSSASPSRKSMLCVPIQSGDIAIGLISADSDQVGFFTEEHERLLSDLASEVGLAIERASLVEALGELSQATGDKARLLGAIVSGAQRLLHVPASVLWVRNPGQDVLSVQAFRGITEAASGSLQLHDDHSFAVQCVERLRSCDRPVCIPNLERGEGHAAKGLELGFSSMLAVPLLAGRDVMGLLASYSRQHRQFSEWSQRLMTTFAEQAATALQRTQLLHEKEAQLDFLKREPELLHSIRKGVESALDLRTILHYILHEGVITGLGGKAVSANFMLYNRESGLLEMKKLEAPTLSGGVAQVEEKERVTAFKPGKGSIAGLVFQTKQAYLCKDIRTDPEAAPIRSDPQKQSLLCVPILSGEVAIGVVNADGGEVGCFDEQEKAWLETLADYAAAAIERASLLQSLRELKGSVADEEHLVKRILKGACDLLHVDRALVWLRHGQRGALKVVAREGAGLEALAECELAADGAFVQDCLQVFYARRQPLTIESIGEATNLPWRDAARRIGIVSMLAVPLLTEQKVQGLITAFSSEPRQFAPVHCDVAVTFAEEAAVAIENAVSSRGTRQQLQVMQALRDTSFLIASEADLLQVLTAIVKRAVELLKGDAGLVYLFNGDAGELEVAASHGFDADYRDLRLQPGEGLAGKVYQCGEPLAARHDEGPSQSPGRAHRDVGTEVGIPLARGETAIGVILVTFGEDRSPTLEDMGVLELFAQYATMAVDKAQHWDELVATQAVAWMAIWGFTFSHEARQKGIAISHNIYNLRGLLRQAFSGQGAQSQLLEALLKEMQEDANVIMSMPVPKRVGGKERVAPESIVIDDELRTQVSSLCRERSDVRPEFRLTCGETRARIGRGWLKIVLSTLIDNALQMMPQGGSLAVCTARRGDMVEIQIVDSGMGIPSKVVPYFLKGRVPKNAGEEGSGMGALMARFILRKHGGDLKLQWTHPGQGTALLATVPMETEPAVGGLERGSA
jgi:GAF domain-containing protein